jgi:hypothetical protein
MDLSPVGNGEEAHWPTTSYIAKVESSATLAALATWKSGDWR